MAQGIGSPTQTSQGRSSNPCRHDFRFVLSECVDGSPQSVFALYVGFAGITRKHCSANKNARAYQTVGDPNVRLTEKGINDATKVGRKLGKEITEEKLIYF